MSKRSSSQLRSSVKPVPAFSSTALEIRDSPPLTSSLHSRNSASSVQESAYLRQAGLLRWARLGLSILLVGVGATIVGCEGHALHTYNMTALNGAFFLPLWPANADLRPTIGTLAAGAIVVASSLLYFLVALIPSPRSRILYLNLLFLSATVLGLMATVFATAYSTILNNADMGTRDTIHTWTCKWYDGANNFNSDVISLELPMYKGIVAPSGFGRVCRESMAGFGLTFAGVGIEVIALTVAAVGLWIESRISKVRKQRAMGDAEKWVNRPAS